MMLSSSKLMQHSIQFLRNLKFGTRFGAPKVIISDQGREFVNSVCKKLFKLTKVRHKISSAYHPQTNGLIERYNQTLQRSLVKLVNKEQDNWDIFLEGVLFAYRTSAHKSTGVPPFEIMLGRRAILPIETEEQCASSSLIEDSDSNDLETAMNKMTDVKKTLYQKAHDNILSAQQRYKRDYDKKHCKGKCRTSYPRHQCPPWGDTGAQGPPWGDTGAQALNERKAKIRIQFCDVPGNIFPGTRLSGPKLKALVETVERGFNLNNGPFVKGIAESLDAIGMHRQKY
eukprot:Em0007g352a